MLCKAHTEQLNPNQLTKVMPHCVFCMDRIQIGSGLVFYCTGAPESGGFVWKFMQVCEIGICEISFQLISCSVNR